MWQNAIFTSVVALKQRQLLTRQFNFDARASLRAIPSEFLDIIRQQAVGVLEKYSMTDDGANCAHDTRLISHDNRFREIDSSAMEPRRCADDFCAVKCDTDFCSYSRNYSLQLRDGTRLIKRNAQHVQFLPPDDMFDDAVHRGDLGFVLSSNFGAGKGFEF